MPNTELRPTRSAETADDGLSSAVTDSLRTPLAVLRAALETLGRSFDAGDERALVLDRALGEVIRLAKHVQTLVDYALPQPLRPLPCSASELARSALEGLTPERRARVMTATEGGDARLLVDGPLAARALARLVACGLDGTREPVLIHARGTARGACFSVLHEGFDGGARPGADADHAAGIRALGLALARRDLERLGAACTSRRTPQGLVLSEVRFDHARPPEPRAEKARATKERA